MWLNGGPAYTVTRPGSSSDSRSSSLESRRCPWSCCHAISSPSSASVAAALRSACADLQVSADGGVRADMIGPNQDQGVHGGAKDMTRSMDASARPHQDQRAC